MTQAASSDQNDALPPKTNFVFKGFTEQLIEGDGSYFGVSECANPHHLPIPFQHGDYIALYRDNAREQLLVEGWLVKDAAALAADKRYIGNRQVNTMIPYNVNPLYMYVARFDEDAVKEYMTEHPYSKLAEDLDTESKILTPPTTLALFAQELATIVIRDNRSKPSGAKNNTLSI